MGGTRRERGRACRRPSRGEPVNRVAVLGPGRIGRQIALAFALGGHQVSLVDLKDRPAGGTAAVFADARREIGRDLRLMAEEGVIENEEIAPALERLEDRIGLAGLDGCEFVQEALPELIDLKCQVLERVSAHVAPEAIIASTSSTISPGHLEIGRASCRERVRARGGTRACKTNKRRE